MRRRLAELAPGVELLDNLRFDPGETANDPAFVQELIAGQDLYVNDAFGASHRAHASIVGPPQFLPSAAGRLLQREVEVLLPLRTEPKRPFVVILGGSKVSDKLGVIDALSKVADALIIGGGMCFTFLAAQGHSVGSSLLEEDQIETCRRLLDSDVTIHIPHDLTVLGPGGKIGDPSAGGEVRQVGAYVPDGWMGLDIGPGTAAEFSDIIARGPHRSSGTAPWACSRTPASQPAPVWSPRPSPRLGASPSSVGATPPPPSTVRPRRRDRPRLHRWWCLPRAARERRPPRPRGPQKGPECLTASRSSPATGR